VTVVEETQVAPRPTPVQIGGARGGPPLTTVLRKDNWRLQPILVSIGLLGFIGYSIWAALRNGNFYAGSVGRDYLSPLYSPCLTHSCESAGYVWGPIFGDWWTISPAWLILIFPGLFRTTCYYYRKAYYRSFWLSPPACAVPDAGSQRDGFRKRYSGETRLPLILQNVHRYSWYFAVIFAGILTWDAITAFRFPNGLGLGIGTILFVVNAVFIWSYTLGCHACRHICGGNAKQFSRSPIRHWFWKNISTPLNEHHQLFAWCSLFSIIACDLYVWLVASGTIHDPRIF
jgi:hypothetical protein